MTGIADVIARQQAIDAALPLKDGVAWFNKLYLRVTQAVQTALGEGVFREPAAVERLAVIFAGLYLKALDDYGRDRVRAPRCWRPLFDRRGDERIAPIQFALAGMNAHINRDLPIAVVRTCDELGLAPEQGTPFHQDFERLNPILEQVQATVKEWFQKAFVAELDRAFGDVDDIIAIWSVAAAREAAWTNAETLWVLRGFPSLEARLLNVLDGMVGFAGRGLLTPTG